MFGLGPGQVAELGKLLPYVKSVAVDLQPLLRAEAPDLVTVPGPTPRVLQLLHSTAGQAGLPPLVLEGLAAVLSGFRPEHSYGRRAGLLGVPLEVHDPDDLDDDTGPPGRLAASLHAGATALAREAQDRAAGLPAALVAYVEAGLPEQWTDRQRRVQARRTVSAVIGYVAVKAIERRGADLPAAQEATG